MSPINTSLNQEEISCFATHDTWGIIDTGATKTVIGSRYIKEFLEGIHPTYRKKIRRGSCQVTFRFGNQGTLQAHQCLVIPVGKLWLKIASVPGATPLLLSNTLLRALGASVDTKHNRLVTTEPPMDISLRITDKGLYLLDVNELIKGSEQQIPCANPEAETFVQTDLNEVHKLVADSTPAEKTQSRPRCAAEVEGNASRNTSIFAESSHSNTAEANRRSEVSHHAAVLRSKQKSPSSVFSNPRVTHGIVGTTTGEAGICRTGSGIDRPLDSRGTQSSPSDLRKDSDGQDVRGDMERSKVDQVVSGVRTYQSEDRTSPDDAFHPTDDRGSRDPGQPPGPEDQAQERSRTKEHCCAQSIEPGTSIRGVLRGGVRDLQHGRDNASDTAERDQRPPEQNVPVGGGPATSHPASLHVDHGHADRSPRTRTMSMQPLGQDIPKTVAHDDQVYVAGEVDSFCESNVNKETLRFQKLVQQMEKELLAIAHSTRSIGIQHDLFEVFCSEDSQLTHQMQSLKGKAKRFSRHQGDLQTAEGRATLFRELCRDRPKHVWVSPDCGPWSMRSNFNSGRSLTMHDKVIQERHQKLSQVALCFVLCRYQHRNHRHAHREQPKGSHMFRIPSIQEIFQYMLCTEPDLCVAGDLRDPVTQEPIKKGLTILTTSTKLKNQLDSLKCSGDHSHQVIEGNTTYLGKVMSRSSFTAKYPRKFARSVSQCLLKTQFPLERPAGSIADPMLSVIDVALAASSSRSIEEPPAKRARQASHAASRGLKHGTLSAAIAGKRRRLNGRQEGDPTAVEGAEEIMKEVEKTLPRVGKTMIQDPQILQRLQQLCPDKVIRYVIACKGTDRKIAPQKIRHHRKHRSVDLSCELVVTKKLCLNQHGKSGTRNPRDRSLGSRYHVESI